MRAMALLVWLGEEVTTCQTRKIRWSFIEEIGSQYFKLGRKSGILDKNSCHDGLPDDDGRRTLLMIISKFENVFVLSVFLQNKVIFVFNEYLLLFELKHNNHFSRFGQKCRKKKNSTFLVHDG